MNCLKLANHLVRQTLLQSRAVPLLNSRLFSASKVVESGDKTENDPLETAEYNAEASYPTYKQREGESLDTMRARLLYQSRKRGTLENGLLLSTFAFRYLSSLTPNQLEQYDQLINKPSNDWDIYYWVVGTKPVPKEFDNELFALLKKHAQNDERELRVVMPDLLKH